jgi:HD superfamily phosphohydrolase
MDHPRVQRLRYVRQLGLTYLAYPGAVHSRFEHSLGVMELVTRAFEGLVRDHRKELEDELASMPGLGDKTLERGLQVLRLAALLHDVAHAPFSHAGEALLGKSHEELAAQVIRGELSEPIDSEFFEGAAELVANLIEKPDAVPFLRQFVAGEMDMDRTDYLRRDSLHCGVDYGLFDFRRLLESLTVARNPLTGRLQLAIRRGGEHAFEGLILARYQMSTQVYLHKIRRIYDHYLREYLEGWKQEHGRELEEVLEYSDHDVLAQMAQDAKSDKPSSGWAKRILERRHHKVVYDTGDAADVTRLKKARKILESLREEFGNIDFLLDNSPLTIHKLTVPGDQEESKVEDLYIVEEGGRLTLLTEDSAIIGKIPKSVRTVRIFADATGDRLEEIRAHIRALEARP